MESSLDVWPGLKSAQPFRSEASSLKRALRLGIYTLSGYETGTALYASIGQFLCCDSMFAHVSCSTPDFATPIPFPTPYDAGCIPPKRHHKYLSHHR